MLVGCLMLGRILTIDQQVYVLLSDLGEEKPIFSLGSKIFHPIYQLLAK